MSSFLSNVNFRSCHYALHLVLIIIPIYDGLSVTLHYICVLIIAPNYDGLPITLHHIYVLITTPNYDGLSVTSASRLCPVNRDKLINLRTLLLLSGHGRDVGDVVSSELTHDSFQMLNLYDSRHYSQCAMCNYEFIIQIAEII